MACNAGVQSRLLASISKKSFRGFIDSVSLLISEKKYFEMRLMSKFEEETEQMMKNQSDFLSPKTSTCRFSRD